MALNLAELEAYSACQASYTYWYCILKSLSTIVGMLIACFVFYISQPCLVIIGKKVCQIHKNQGNTSTFVASFVLFAACASCGHLVNRLCRCSKYAENIICFQIMTHYPPVKICKYTLMSLNINATDKYHWLIVPLQQNVLLGNFRSWHVMWLVQIALTYVTVNTTEHWW